MIYPASRLLVFTRLPRAGEVKTRLVPLLGAVGAADFHARLIARCLQMATGAGLCPVEMWCTPTCDDPFFHACRERYGVALHEQGAGDLGDRMHGALASALKRAESAVLVGTDIPALEAADIDAAFQTLQRDVDVVLGPALDGGYYLIGMKRPDPGLFEGIRWGSSVVFRDTVSRLMQRGNDWHCLREHRDVDTVEDFQQLAEPIKRALKEVASIPSQRVTGVGK